MIYMDDGDIVVRTMEAADAPKLAEGFAAQGWHVREEKYLNRLQDQAEGKCTALTAAVRGQPVGTVYLYYQAQEGPFKGSGVPIIADLNVLRKEQRRGIGGKLMDAAERLAAQRADRVGLGVGLCREYGSAQRMYVKRGYVPDGSGVWYNGRPCVQYQTVCTVDDDLVLYLQKRLPR